jgi:hypothetical protein
MSEFSIVLGTLLLHLLRLQKPLPFSEKVLCVGEQLLFRSWYELGAAPAGH